MLPLTIIIEGLYMMNYNMNHRMNIPTYTYLRCIVSFMPQYYYKYKINWKKNGKWKSANIKFKNMQSSEDIKYTLNPAGI